MNNRQKGLALYKLANVNVQMTKVGMMQFLKTLPRAGKAILKYKPQQMLQGVKSFFGAEPAQLSARAARTSLNNQRKYYKAINPVGEKWQQLNPWVQRAIKYPSQIGLGYAAGIPIGLPGFLGFDIGNRVELGRAKQEGAGMALQGVHQQMEALRQGLGGMGLMDRAGLGFKLLTDKDFLTNMVGNKQNEVAATLKKLKQPVPTYGADNTIV